MKLTLWIFFHSQLRKSKKVNIEPKESLSLQAVFNHYFPDKTYQGKFTLSKKAYIHYKQISYCQHHSIIVTANVGM